MHIRAMHRRVASGAPTPTLTQPGSVRHIADIDFARCSLHLRMAFQAEVRIALDQQLSVHRAMRIVTYRAPLPQRFVLKNKWPRLLAMTLRAILVRARHGHSRLGGSRRGFENVGPVRIVALHAIHVSLYYWMMLGHSEFCFRLQVALKTRRRIPSRIHNKFAAPAAHFDMLAPGPMT
jgi:hypothetical protein